MKKVKYETNREKLGKKRPTNYVTLRDPYKNPNFKIIMRKDYVMPYKGMMHNYLGFQPWHKITDPFYDQDNVMKQEVITCITIILLQHYYLHNYLLL